MSILRRALFMAAKRAASDPRVQAKAQQILRDEVAPRAQEVGRRARPELEKANKRIKGAARDLERKISGRAAQD